ncbi:uncharacterized protein LOC118437211 [Folsomia candida]|uniref:uncharacterized protein LOC118437211 n=1 Tax=Folsomia candida TaxID=158441 RepID=UPI001604A63D|nr:uncharacterized protein LOC118437211 [Folsomia candida]
MAPQKSILFDEISNPGLLRFPISARVYQVEEKCLRASVTPYLRLTLTQDLGKTLITVISIGKSYQEIKNFFEVGEEYAFPAGTFTAKERDPGYLAWSNFNYTLWLLPRNAVRHVTNDVSRSSKTRQAYHFGATRADSDNNWRAR